MSVVLLIEVNELVRDTLTKAFERQGHEVLATGDVRHAVAWAKHHTPDVVFAELDLGQGTSGPELLEFIQHKHPRAMRILMSACPILDPRVPHVHDVYLAKPFSVAVIASTLGDFSTPRCVRAA